jgi:hypothetical protein
VQHHRQLAKAAGMDDCYGIPDFIIRTCLSHNNIIWLQSRGQSVFQRLRLPSSPGQESGLLKKIITLLEQKERDYLRVLATSI